MHFGAKITTYVVTVKIGGRAVKRDLSRESSIDKPDNFHYLDLPDIVRT